MRCNRRTFFVFGVVFAVIHSIVTPNARAIDDDDPNDEVVLTIISPKNGELIEQDTYDINGVAGWKVKHRVDVVKITCKLYYKNYRSGNWVYEKTITEYA